MARLLFCDDDATIQMVVRLALRATPHELRLASDGEEGLALAERERPDLIVTDLSMPRLGGLDLLRELKARPGPAQPRPPVGPAAH